MWFTSTASVLPLLTLCGAVSLTDQYQDADSLQSGYLPYHNIDPSKLGTFTKSWTMQFNTSEAFLAKPLTYTPKGFSNELVIVVSNQNIVRVLDGLLGSVLYTRVLDAPFSSADSNCGDISPTIGITGTPIIDPNTDIMYFFSKGYKNGAATGSGTINGQYKAYAVKLPNLTDVPGFPIIIGGPATNDPTRYFVAGTVLQRPGLAIIGNSIIAGFGGHCDNFNYTGLLVTVTKTASVGAMQAMVASPGAPSPQPTDINKQTGGKAGIWQGGMGLAVQGSNVFFTTGNGVGPGVNKNQGVPANGKVPISTLEQVVANFAVDPNTGILTQQDYFEPYNFDTQLNGGDQDISSAGVALLDRGTFNAPAVGVSGIAVASGKNGVIYIMNADNLGGFANNGGKDATLQQIAFNGASFFGGIGSYPLDGGYIYVCPTNGVLTAFKFGLDGNGNPVFTQAGTGPTGSACKGNPTTTSYNGQAGTGVVWMTDINLGLVAYKAVPVNGALQPIALGWATGRLQKFQRPVFGNGRIYTSQTNTIIAVAAPGPPPPVSTLSTSSASSTTSIKTSTSSGVSSSSSTTAGKTSTTSSVSSSQVATPKTSTTTTQTSSSTTSKSSSISSTVSSSLPPTSSSMSTLATSIPSSSTKTSSTSTSTTPRGSVTANPKPKLITLNWSVGWVNAAPDGFNRPLVGINGQFPCPPIVGNIGDTVKINVVNNLGNETTAIHFHGMFQINTTFEDGPAMVTQCPIPPGQTFVYEFTFTQSGTYWYHSHVGGQYIDGLRGPLIIRDNNALANYGNIDNEVTLTLSDFYHVEAPYLINWFLSANNTSGAEPVPNSCLMNEAQNVQIPIVPGKLYQFHIINMGAIAGQYLQFDQHTMTVIEVDGVYIQPWDTQQLFVGVAQRYTVLIRAKATASQNFAIVSQFLTDMFGSSQTPPGQQPTCTGWLVYNTAASLPKAFTLQPQPFDDSTLVPWDQTPMYDSDNVQYVYLTADFAPNSWGSTRSMFNGLTYIAQKVPTFFTALSAPAEYLLNAQIYGQVNPVILPFGAVIELNINNHDTRAHPFHLHGHNFQLISRAGDGTMWPGLYTTPAVPMRRDTVIVYPDTGATIRFVADNPGIQLFHCHTEWHVEAGLTATFLEAPDVMVARKPYIPNSHKTACDVQNIPRAGNAGGNKKNWLDLSGANTDTSPNYYGALINPPATNPYKGP